MSLFRRSHVEARARLFRPDFACATDGVDHLRIEYDPEVWLRCPGAGEDRTSWVQESLDAYAHDYRMASGSTDYRQIAGALNNIADTGLSATATLVCLPKNLRGHMNMTANVLDDELMLLEHGTPETFLTFANDPSREPAIPVKFPKIQASSRSGFDESGGIATVEHAYRMLHTDSTLHLAVTGITNRARDSGPWSALANEVEVYLSDGRIL